MNLLTRFKRFIRDCISVEDEPQDRPLTNSELYLEALINEKGKVVYGAFRITGASGLNLIGECDEESSTRLVLISCRDARDLQAFLRIWKHFYRGRSVTWEDGTPADPFVA